MRDFGLSLRGRVKNFSLPENKSLIPLFEAVVNSLQAIAERQKTCDFLGEISILIDREDTLSEDIIGKIEDIRVMSDRSIIIVLKGGYTIREHVEDRPRKERNISA